MITFANKITCAFLFYSAIFAALAVEKKQKDDCISYEHSENGLFHIATYFAMTKTYYWQTWSKKNDKDHLAIHFGQKHCQDFFNHLEAKYNAEQANYVRTRKIKY